MADRRISTYELLVRLERDALSEIAQHHSALRSRIERSEKEAAELCHRIETEAFASSAEIAPYVGAFISAIRSEITQCNDHRQRLEQEASIVDEKLRERFSTLKTVEFVTARARMAVESAQRKRDEREREEHMLLRHIRNG